MLIERVPGKTLEHPSELRRGLVEDLSQPLVIRNANGIIPLTDLVKGRNKNVLWEDGGLLGHAFPLLSEGQWQARGPIRFASNPSLRLTYIDPF